MMSSTFARVFSENQYIADAAAQIPVMVLNADLAIPNVYSVVSDAFTSMYNATLQMIQSGVSGHRPLSS